MFNLLASVGAVVVSEVKMFHRFGVQRPCFHVIAVLLLVLPAPCTAQARRSWHDILQVSEGVDPDIGVGVVEMDMLRWTQEPSVAPSSTPSRSAQPTVSEAPSDAPSSHPTVSVRPTFSTSSPTHSLSPTTSDAVLFSYQDGAPMGPDQWWRVTEGDAAFFGQYVDIPPHDNQCADTFRRQSPKNLVSQRNCTDDHQIRTTRGKNDWDTIRWEVLPHALRAVFRVQRTNGNATRPATADFSNLSKRVDAYYLDVKTPSEHTMNGTRYHAEVHIGHVSEPTGDMPVRSFNIGFFLDPTRNVHNTVLEEFLREWEEVKWEREWNCQRKKDDTMPEYQRRHPVRNKQEMKRIFVPHDDREGGDADWDLYQLLPTIWYYGYAGSFTVPPCTQHVVWRFLDLPLYLSWPQYQRLRRIVSDQRHPDTCRPVTGVGPNTARPLQRNHVPTFHCTWWRALYPHDYYHAWPDGYHGNNKIYKQKRRIEREARTAMAAAAAAAAAAASTPAAAGADTNTTDDRNDGTLGTRRRGLVSAMRETLRSSGEKERKEPPIIKSSGQSLTLSNRDEKNPSFGDSLWKEWKRKAGQMV